MLKTGLLIVATAGLLAACGNNRDADTPVEGPAISTAEAPMNAPIHNEDGAPAQIQTPGANSFTEAQARSAIEREGYTDIGPLSQDAQGLWQATAKRNGENATVSVDYKGVITVR